MSSNRGQSDMGPSSRTDGSLNINLSGLSPIAEPPSSTTPSKSPFSSAKPSSASLSGLSNTRLGAGSPLLDQTQRLFPKRTRELQTPTGVSSSIWGPPTSGTSTPLFEIPESPSQDGFPDLVPLTETGINSPARRGRAGTLPSRIPPTNTANGGSIPLLTSKTSRPTPSTSPFRPGSTSASEKAFNSASNVTGSSALLSRLRAGSMPQRTSPFGAGALVGQSPFSTNWNSRDRAATLSSITSADDPASPQQASLGKEDPGVRTLDYLGLAETPAREPSFLVDGDGFRQHSSLAADSQPRSSNRFRSFSVNTQPKYPGELNHPSTSNYGLAGSGTLTPSAAAALEAEYEAIQERVRLHNKAVQDFALNASAARPRARTAGLVETPQRSALRRLGQSGLSSADGGALESLLVSDMGSSDLTAALYNLNVNDQAYNMAGMDPALSAFDLPDEAHSQMSRSLWIGSIPNSTTVSTLDTIFTGFGPIESTRVLTHKNCGFVNFENIQDAIRARQLLNGKEIFPGSGPVRIGFAKAPSASMTPVPGAQGQSPVPKAVGDDGSASVHDVNTNIALDGQQPLSDATTARLSELQPEILQIVTEFGAQSSDLPAMQSTIAGAIAYDKLESEIPPIPEPTASRAFDAPRLRDIRKRIDNGACGLQEIEQIALEMLPEIAELSSDYLGNTVVQKLFEFCSEQTKEQMLVYIVPHLAEIGVHKNGTWAAQKIIDVCKTESQIHLIVEHLRPYTVPLFLDQFGNYVLQCCLRFGPAYNNYIFETMLDQLSEISQGRFGARAMRACLESHHSSKDQQRMLAAAIALHSVQLATNANGALLLTWLLDTCTFPKRRTVLAPRLIPHLVQLCTHKVAYLTVLKVVNQRNEPEAREMILNALFFSPGDAVLEQILSDQSSGVTFIFKILTSPFLEDPMRKEVVRNVSTVLVRIKAQPAQGYKRLMDEVGLSSRPAQGSQFPGHSGSAMLDRQKPMSQPGNPAFGAGFPPGMNPPGFEHGAAPVRSASTDSLGFPVYAMGGYQATQQGYNSMPYQQLNPQTQYQGFANPQRNNSAYVTNGYGGYNTPPPGVDMYRGMSNQSASPVPFNASMSPMMNNGGFAQPYSQQGVPGGMYGYGGGAPQQPMYSYNPQNQALFAGNRGGRRDQAGEHPYWV